MQLSDTESVPAMFYTSSAPTGRARTPLLRVLNFLAITLAIYCLLRGYTVLDMHFSDILPPPPSGYGGTMKPLDSGWILSDEDGHSEPAVFPITLLADSEDEVFTFSHAGSKLAGMALTFEDHRLQFTIDVDGEVLYSANNSVLASQVRYTGTRIVNLPAEDHPFSTITFTIHGVSGSCELDAPYYGTPSAAYSETLNRELMTQILLWLFLIFAVILVSFGLYADSRGFADRRVFTLGMFLFCAVGWSWADSRMPAITGVPQEIVGMLCYFFLAAMPVPIIYYVHVSCGRRYRQLEIIAELSPLNLLLQSALSLSGLVRLEQMIVGSHALTILGIVVCSVYLLRPHLARQPRNDTDNEPVLQLLGYVVLFISAAVAMLLYWAAGGAAYRNAMLFGILLHVVLLFASLVVRFLHMLNSSQVALAQALMEEELAHLDYLTGLPNRRACEKELIRIEKELPAGQDAMLYIVDVNGLKHTNDTFGHRAGDDLIVAAARALKEAFGDSGECFRIGGDEFVALLTGPEIDTATVEARFRETVSRCSVGVGRALSLAIGGSHLCRPDGSRLSISDWQQEADLNMYRDKAAHRNEHAPDTAKDLKDIIDCIVRTVEAKDHYTATHSDRVKELSVFIGEKMGLSATTLTQLGYAAYLHDIGKIGVPDHILTKPGRLTDEEYAVIRRHAAIGADIIGSARGMGEIARIIRHHHERFDGKGYPEGLADTEIPLCSRIIAVADSIDAMTSKRVYRDRLEPEICRREIERNIGRMYAPSVARIVLENWAGIEKIIAQNTGSPG